jgi:hypothetical protein
MFRQLIRLPLLAAFCAWTATSANAATFSNQYVSFELPSNWSCKLEGTEWLCVSQLEKQSKEAIIILTAKEAGPNDNLDAYVNHVKTERVLQDVSGKPVSSKVLNVKQRTINNHPWVDGMQLGSEIASYYTRYLGTVKDRLAILVSFSAHKSHYTKYSQDFLKAVDSLRVVASKDLLAPPSQVAMGTGANERIGSAIQDVMPIGTADPLPAEPRKSTPILRYLLGFALLLVALGVYFLRKK